MTTPDSSIVAADSSTILPDPFFKPDECPYVGLRSFESSDRRYFCGRSMHIAEILDRLKDHHLVAVVGLSGSGKSSLVRAGVIPDLRADRLKDSGSDWLIAMITPGTEPLKRIGDELITAVKEYYGGKQKHKQAELPPESFINHWGDTVHQALNSGSLGLAKAIATAGLSLQTRLLLVVDQFEELFRYWKRTSRDGRDEVEVFIQQLLELTSDPDSRVYVILTMRSEYLGDCARYEGLAEAVNAGLYLTPRLNRDELRQAIEIPAQKCNRRIASELVQRLLNDVANDQDQLPVLQHALMRCWEKSLEAGSTVIGDTMYEAIGGPNALDVHAEQIFKQLGEGSGDLETTNQAVAEALFKRITKRATGPADEEKRTDGTRDATELGTICLETGFVQENVTPVIEVFRQRNCAFLRPTVTETKELTQNSTIDITHESLIRKWKRLGEWVREESQSADLYLQLSARARKARSGEFLSQSELELYTSWQHSGAQTEKWALRYGGDYNGALRYLGDSREFQKSQKWKKIRAILIPSTIVGVVLLVAAYQNVREKERTIDFEKGLRKVSSDGLSTTWRVPAAIEEAAVAADDSTGTFKQELEQQVRLDQWEMFSALRSGLSLNSHHAAWSKVDSSCGVAVDQSHQYAAVADHISVKIWDLAKAKAALALHKATDPIMNEPFPGVDCVRFSPGENGLLLLGSTNSDNPLELHGGTSLVRWWKFSPQAKTFIESSDSISTVDAPISISFVANSNMVSLLTATKVLLYEVPDKGPLRLSSTYPGDGSTLDAKNGPVRAGMFNADGTYLVVSYYDGQAEILSLRGDGLAPRPLTFTDTSNDSVQSVAFSVDSSRIVTGSELGRIWIQTNPWIKGALPSDWIAKMAGSISAVALYGEAESEMVAAGTVSGDAAVFQASRAGEEPRAQEPWQLNPKHQSFGRRFMHFGSISTVSFSTDGKELVTASGDQKARVFDINTGLERTRISHLRPVVSAIALSRLGDSHELMVSASQDADFEITDLDRRYQTVLTLPADDSCPQEALSASRRGVWPSVVTWEGLWTWICNGQLHSFGEGNALPYGEALPESIHFSQDGSTAAWLDPQLGIHCARRSDRSKPWTTAREAWVDTDTREPKPFGSVATLPVLTLSSNGEFVGVSFVTKDNRNIIEVLRLQEDSSGVRLDQLRNEGANPGEVHDTHEPQVRPYGVDAGDQHILVLSVDSRGSIAAGTVDNRVFRFRRETNRWTPLSVKIPQDTTGALGPQNRVITAVAFVDKVDGNLLVARRDSSIWLFSAAGEPLYPPAATPVPGDDAAAQTFAFSKSGKQVAAVKGASVTIFTINSTGLIKGTTLQEPGAIQSIAFDDSDGGDVAFTVVAIRDSLVRIKHNLNVERHEQWVCDEQPNDQDKTASERCRQLRKSRSWVRGACFWPIKHGGTCPNANNE